jgi:glycosyltransferase involved in cell wall biosynthesis
MQVRILDRVYASVLDLKSSIADKRRWHAHGGATDDCPRVYYGVSDLPSRNDEVGGGIIKCQDLADAYPNCFDRCNILYLVSSALPVGVVPMIRNAGRRGVRVVLNQNGVAYPAWHGPGWQRTNAPLAAVLSAADYVFYQSEFCRVSAKRFLGMVARRSEILFNMVDTGLFTPGTPPSRVTILMSGSHHGAYRIMTGLDAFATLRKSVPGAKMIVAGRYCWKKNEADALAEARARAHELGIIDAVEFRGRYSQADAPSLFREATLLLHTKYNDPCPRLVVESLAAGVPVVYSSSGGVPELVGMSAGEGVPAPTDWDRDHPPDPASLAEAMLKVIQSRDSYSMAARSRAVEMLDVRLWIRRHVEVFRMLLHEQ